MTDKPDHQRTGFQQDAVAGGLGRRIGCVRSLFQVARPLMVDGGGWDREHGYSRKHGEKRDEKKNGALGKGVANGARHERDDDVAGMVEGEISPHAPGQLFPGIEPQGQGRYGRPENVAGDCKEAIGYRHGPETRHDEYRRGSYCQHDERQNDEASLGVGFVDGRADRRLEREAEQAADCRHQADLRLAPMLLGDHEDVEVRPERPVDVGEQKIEGVEGDGTEAGFGRPNVRRGGVHDNFIHDPPSSTSLQGKT
jgi:hypothetical protein